MQISIWGILSFKLINSRVIHQNGQFVKKNNEMAKMNFDMASK